MKLITNILMFVLVAGCATRVPINGTYDVSYNIPHNEKGWGNDIAQNQWGLFAHYKGSPDVVYFITEIEYPHFIYLVHYVEGNEEKERIVWEIRKLDENRYQLLFNNGPELESTIELIYDPNQQILSSKLIKYKKR